MRLPLLIVLLTGLALCGNASAQMVALQMPPMAEAKPSPETLARFNTVKTGVEKFSRSGSVQRALTDLRLAIDDPRNTPDAKSMLVSLNGQIAEMTHDPEHAAALYQQAASVPGAQPQVKVQALSALALLQMKQSRPKEAADAFSAMLQIPALNPDSRAVALISRASISQTMQRTDDAYADLTAAAAVPDASPRHRVVALLQRTNVPKGEAHWEQDIAEALAVPEIPPEMRSCALLMRATSYRAGRLTDKVLADCQTILSSPGAAPNDRAGALTLIAEDQLTRYEFDAATRGLDEALAQHALQPDTQATAHLTRCKMHMLQNDYPKAYMDLRAAEHTDKISPAMQQLLRQQKLMMEGR